MKARVDFVNYAKVLDNFDGDTTEGRRKYRQFVYKGLEKDAENPLEMGKNSGIVGLSDFKAYIREKYLDGTSRESQREQPQLKAVKEIYTPKVLIKHVCKIIGSVAKNYRGCERVPRRACYTVRPNNFPMN